MKRSCSSQAANIKLRRITGVESDTGLSRTLSRTELFDGNSEYLWENSRKQVLWPQFLQNTELFFEWVFMLLPCAAERSELISALWKTCFYHMQFGLVSVYTLLRWLCNWQSINCPMFWITWLLAETLHHLSFRPWITPPIRAVNN